MSAKLLIRVVSEMCGEYPLYIKSESGYYLPDLTVWRHRALQYECPIAAEKAIERLTKGKNFLKFKVVPCKERAKIDETF